MGIKHPLDENPPFIVSATEALLLGIAVEEYRRDRVEGYIGRLFVSYLMRWLRPFVPMFSRSKIEPIPPDRLPKDVEWSLTDSQFGCGISPTEPDILFLNPKEGILFRFVFDISRQSLLDQVVRMLQDQIHIPNRYYISITPETTDQVVKAWHEVYSSPQPTSFELAINEDSGKILSVLNQLVESSNQSLAFNLGRQFGHVFQELEMFKQLVFDAEDDCLHWEQARLDHETGIEAFKELKEKTRTAIMELQRGDFGLVLELLSDELGWEQEAIETLKSFIKQESGDNKPKLVQLVECLINNHVEEQEMAINDQGQIGDFEDCFHHHLDLSEVFTTISESPPLKWSSHSPAMLKLKTQVSFEPKNEESIRATQTTAQEEMHELIAVTWMALGEVIGVLRENDKLFQQMDCEEVIPRVFSDWIRAPLDKIESLVFKCHQLFGAISISRPSGNHQYVVTLC